MQLRNFKYITQFEFNNEVIFNFEVYFKVYSFLLGLWIASLLCLPYIDRLKTPGIYTCKLKLKLKKINSML